MNGIIPHKSLNVIIYFSKNNIFLAFVKERPAPRCRAFFLLIVIFHVFAVGFDKLVNHCLNVVN